MFKSCYTFCENCGILHLCLNFNDRIAQINKTDSGHWPAAIDWLKDRGRENKQDQYLVLSLWQLYIDN